LEHALLLDGFVLARQTRTGGRFYKCDDGRRTVIHFHRGSDTLPPGTLGFVLAATRWTEDDARRLGLL
jgi:predicted RNA binding protein YcfA (HicA-like mRNA interferase family)